MAPEPSVQSLSIVIPAYNEANRLPPSLAKVLAYATESAREIDLVLVDDGSSDGTAEVARQVVGAKLPLTVLTNDPNRGKGYSVCRGMLEAEGECVLFTDADLSTPIEEADRLVAAIEGGADIAIGSRGMKESDIQVHQPWWREYAGRLFGRLMRLMAVRGLHDTQCGFKCFRRGAAQAVFPRQTLAGWAFDVEVLIIAHKLGYAIAEIPVRWVNDPESKVSLLTDGPKMLADVVRARWRHRGLSATQEP